VQATLLTRAPAGAAYAWQATVTLHAPKQTPARNG